MFEAVDADVSSMTTENEVRYGYILLKSVRFGDAQNFTRETFFFILFIVNTTHMKNNSVIFTQQRVFKDKHYLADTETDYYAIKTKSRREHKTRPSVSYTYARCSFSSSYLIFHFRTENRISNGQSKLEAEYPSKCDKCQ